ncbi:MAG: hypothetical protein K6E36_06265 [Oscillospiraceae bacterium]|nr:hypothetical protein [Oscillospiraceae bacterium]
MMHTCPHCGKKTFSPLLKARCGGMSSVGKHCPECGTRCVNGKTSLAVHIALSLTGLILVLYNYFTQTSAAQFLLGGVLPFFLCIVLGFVYDMFFGKLIEAIKRE